MHKKFEVNWTKIKGGCQSERKVSQLNSYSKMPLVTEPYLTYLASLYYLGTKTVDRELIFAYPLLDRSIVTS